MRAQRRIIAGFGLAIGLGAAAAGCRTGEQSVNPGINDSYRDANVNEWKQRFESESREIYANRHGIMDALALAPGTDVADVGAGTGFFTLMMANRVGGAGTVYAVDITPAFLDAIRERASEQGLRNVVTIRCAADDVLLPAASVDAVFVCDTYHHFEYPMSTLASIHRALRDGGELMVIDFARVPGVSRDWIMDHVRAGQETVIDEITAAGFDLVEKVPAPFLEENYMLRFRKDDGA